MHCSFFGLHYNQPTARKTRAGLGLGWQGTLVQIIVRRCHLPPPGLCERLPAKKHPPHAQRFKRTPVVTAAGAGEIWSKNIRKEHMYREVAMWFLCIGGGHAMEGLENGRKGNLAHEPDLCPCDTCRACHLSPGHSTQCDLDLTPFSSEEVGTVRSKTTWPGSSQLDRCSDDLFKS